MLDNHKITPRQFAALVFLTTVGDSILVLPASPAEIAKQDAWIAAILGLALGLFVLYMMSTLARRFPQLTLVEMSWMLLGKWIGTCAAWFFLLYTMLNAAAFLSGMGNFLSTYMMVNTPYEIILLVYLSIGIMGARLGVEVITRAAELFTPWFLLLFVAFVLMLIPQIEWENIQPVFENGLKPILNGAIPTIAYPFIELSLFLMMFPAVLHSRHAQKSFLVGGFFGGVVLVVMVMLCILVLGYTLTSQDLYPSYSLSLRIIVGNWLQRIEAIMAILWFLSIFFKLTLSLYVISRGLAQVLHLQDYRIMSIPTGVLIMYPAITFAPNIPDVLILTKVWPYLDITAGFLFPLILLLIAYARNKRHA